MQTLSLAALRPPVKQLKTRWQPFLPLLPGVALFVVVLAALGMGFWRSATNLQGHVRAGAQVVLDALTAQTRPVRPAPGKSFADVHELLPGLGTLAAVRLEAESPAVGKTLAQLKLRGDARRGWRDRAHGEGATAGGRRPGAGRDARGDCGGSRRARAAKRTARRHVGDAR